MGFGNGAYAKIKSVIKSTDKVTECKITISKKNPKTQQYELQFAGYVKFIGKAHLQRPMENQRIKIVNCDVTNAYVKNGVLEFNQKPVFIIYEYELQDEQSTTHSYSQPSEYVSYPPPEVTSFETLTSNFDIPF